jgi:iron complex outermembrane receptor protein
VGLPTKVQDQHTWAARGTFRIQPPDSESEFFLSAHGSRLDQDATLGQVIGRRDIQGARAGFPDGAGQYNFGGPIGTGTAGGYWEPDAREEYLAYCGRSDPNRCPQNFFLANDELVRQLARRPLDQRPYRGDYDLIGGTTRDAWGTFGSAEGEYRDLDLFFIASYDQYERTNRQDIDFSPELLFDLEDEDEAWQTYQELRISGELASTPFEWEVGGYYLEESLDFDGTTHVFGGGNFVDLQRAFTQEIQSAGGWFEFGWDFADDFTLEGGVRWNWETKTFDFARLNTTRSGITGAVVREERDSIDQDETWQTPTGQIILRDHLNDSSSAYAKYTRGFKAGHFNAGVGRDISAPPADEEYNDAWETGLQGSWLDRRVSLLGAFFYYRYENYQVFLFTSGGVVSAPPVLEILNAKRAENYGIEVEGRIEPLRGWVPQLIEGLRLSGNFSWLHGEYLDFQQIRKLPAGTAGQPDLEITVDYSGKQLQNAPRYKVSGTAEWTLDFGRWGYVIPRYDLNWSDAVYFDPNEGRGTPAQDGRDPLPQYGVGQNPFFLHNVRLAYRTPTGNVEVAGWVRNLTDEVYKNYAFDASAFAQLVLNFVGEPRTIGMDLTITF